jgi:DNA-binding transcriptional ArsR family regulator
MHHGELAAVEAIFRALAHSVRLAIVARLREGEQCVHQLVEHLGVPQPLVSQHLRTLRTAGIVRARRHGTEMHYSLADAHIGQIVGDAIDHVREKGAPPAK